MAGPQLVCCLCVEQVSVEDRAQSARNPQSLLGDGEPVAQVVKERQRRSQLRGSHIQVEDGAGRFLRAGHQVAQQILHILRRLGDRERNAHGRHMSVL